MKIEYFLGRSFRVVCGLKREIVLGPTILIWVVKKHILAENSELIISNLVSIMRRKTFLGRHKVQLEFLRRMVPQQGFVKYADRYHQYHLLICMKSFTTKDFRPNVEMFFSAAIYHDLQQDVRNPQGGRGVHQSRAGSQTEI